MPIVTDRERLIALMKALEFKNIEEYWLNQSPDLFTKAGTLIARQAKNSYPILKR